ncbi:hypothetical protein MSAN_01143000 [Mycena sanguinolenta]|uniref:Uncharacterized protein n=1 Tax=Mycena sanguinolenta TaxID=230812 RepID=A0A8H6YH39_9AGAR|nr:hypothetical protein MSAN_01143000 [Mycena sanguinolenta]
MLIRLLSPLLFYAPHSQLLGLEALTVDGIIHSTGWALFVKGLNNEWQESIINAAVVLNANVGFLSIQSADQGGNFVSTRSPAQIASYVSILASIASMIIATFILNPTHPRLGLETLAVMYSLPYKMLIWSMVSFLTAFSFACFQKTSLITRTLVAVVWGIVAAFILWCAFKLWETRSCWASLRDLVSCLRCLSVESAEDEADPTHQEGIYQTREIYLFS